jgi:hypothetical protein
MDFDLGIVLGAIMAYLSPTILRALSGRGELSFLMWCQL